MKSRAPIRVGKDAIQILEDYESDAIYNTGDNQIVVHSNRICTYKEKAGRKEQPVLDRLRSKTEFVDHPNFDTPCWLFEGMEEIHSYKQIWYHGKYVRIHRLALILEGATLTRNMHVDHLCERKNCWNTAHLEETTPGDNTRRYHAKKGR